MSDAVGKMLKVNASCTRDQILEKNLSVSNPSTMYFPNDENSLFFNGKEIAGAISSKIAGQVNLASNNAYDTLQSIANGLGSNELVMYLISDSSGMLPSLKNETHYLVHDSVVGLFTNDNNFAVNVGDILVIARLKKGIIHINTFKIIPLNDAKAQSDTNPGVMGLESPWDKKQINKIPNLETTINYLCNNIPTNGNITNMNEALTTGIYPWCTLGRPTGSTGAYTCFSIRSTSVDSNGLYSTLQFAFGRQGELGKVYTRMIFYEPNGDGSKDLYLDWSEITGGSECGLISAGPFTSNADLNNYVNNLTNVGLYEVKYNIDNKTGSLFVEVNNQNGYKWITVAGPVDTKQEEFVVVTYDTSNRIYREIYKCDSNDWYLKFDYQSYNSLISKYNSIFNFEYLNYLWNTNTNANNVEYRIYYVSVGLITISNYNTDNYKRQRITGPIINITNDSIEADPSAPIVTWERKSDYVDNEGNAIWYIADKHYIQESPIQISYIADVPAGDKTFDTGVLLKNITDDNITANIRLVGMSEGTYVNTVLYPGWNVELVIEIIGATVNTLQYGY